MSGNEFPDKPRVAVAALVTREGRILAVRRGRPPGEDSWALPGGSVELGETLVGAAEREVMEETGVSIRAVEPCTAVDAIYSSPDGAVRFHYVIVYMRAEYLGGIPHPMDDAAEARWVTLRELESLRTEPRTLEIIRQSCSTQAGE